MQTWICLTGSPKLANVNDFQAPGCGLIFRFLWRKMKHSSMLSLSKLYQFKLTNYMTKKGWTEFTELSRGKNEQDFLKELLASKEERSFRESE